MSLAAQQMPINTFQSIRSRGFKFNRNGARRADWDSIFVRFRNDKFVFSCLRHRHSAWCGGAFVSTNAKNYYYAWNLSTHVARWIRKIAVRLCHLMWCVCVCALSRAPAECTQTTAAELCSVHNAHIWACKLRSALIRRHRKHNIIRRAPWAPTPHFAYAFHPNADGPNA